MAKKKSGLGTDAFYQQPKPDSTSEPAPQQAGKPASQQASIPVSQYTSTPARQRILELKRYMEHDKAKATFYLAPDTLEDLEEAWMRLRRMVGKLEAEQKSKVSKSLIVEAALQIVLEELEQEAMDSRLAKKLTSFW